MSENHANGNNNVCWQNYKRNNNNEGYSEDGIDIWIWQRKWNKFAEWLATILAYLLNPQNDGEQNSDWTVIGKVVWKQILEEDILRKIFKNLIQANAFNKIIL